MTATLTYTYSPSHSKLETKLSVLHRELEHNILVGEGLVHIGKSLKLGLNVDQILGVKVDLEGLGTVSLISNSLADNLGRVYNILQYGLVDGGQGSGHRAGALLCGLSVEGLGEDGSLSNNDHVSAAELLLELADNSRLDLVEILQLAERNKDDDSLAASIQFHLLGSGYIQSVEISLKLSGRGLQVEKLLCNRELKLVGHGAARLHNLGSHFWMLVEKR
mmetsp:Transcript_16388/g.32816  ORF Transcript_16388/g.32816 Transcript_16388/m.32816 type:complete len:220 (+) Transcript_16388:114-773(+)